MNTLRTASCVCSRKGLLLIWNAPLLRSACQVEETDTYYGRNKQRNLISEQEADRWRIENKRVPIFLKVSQKISLHRQMRIRAQNVDKLEWGKVHEKEWFVG